MFGLRYIDPTYLIILPALILAFWAQSKVKSTFAKYANVPCQSGVTGAQVAQKMLEDGGLHDVVIEHIAGQLSDHYDPRTKTLRLSDGVYHSCSLASLGVAAHEVGHAFQHHEGYVALTARNSIAPVASVSSQAAVPLFLLGLIFSLPPLLYVGIAAFALAVLFSLITLPVEFNASSRALDSLERGRFLSSDEVPGAGAVLRAAAMTYLASAFMALSQLVRLIFLAGNSRRRN